MLFEKLKSKEGISPILATLLLIVIAVAAIIITYAWVMTYMGAQTSAGGVLLDVENVSWNSTAKNTTIVVKNTGTSDAKIVRLYIGETASNLIDVTSNTNLGTGKTLPVNQRLNIVLSWPNAFASNWTNSKTYHFKVAPESGQPKEFTAQAPA